MSEIVQTIELSKRFGKTLVLDRVNLSLEAGSIYGLLGANGAGKTTTFEILMNLEQPSSGQASVLGRDSTKLRGRDFGQIGYVCESQELPQWMTVAEFMAYLKPFYPRWDNDLAQKLLHDFDLPEQRELRHLSRGMRMKVALASSLAYRPRLLLMDEPLSALDALTRDELIEGLLANAGDLSILLSSHDLNEIESFASHIGYLESGRLAFSEETSSLMQRFREVEITLDGDSNPPISRWLSSWLRVDQNGPVIRLVESQFQQERTMSEIYLLFQNVKQVAVKAMSLRSIFVTLAKASRRTW